MSMRIGAVSCLLSIMSVVPTARGDNAAMLGALASRYASDRDAAVAALSKIEKSALQQLVPDLVAHIEKGNWLAQSSAAKVLQAAGPVAKEAIPKLQEAVRAGMAKGRRAFVSLMIDTIAAIDPGAGAALVADIGRSLKSEDTLTVTWACEALAKIGPGAKEALPAVMELFNGKDSFLSCSAASVLAGMKAGAEPAIPDLIKALSMRDDPVKVQAARALGSIGGAASKAIPDLSRSLSSANRDLAQESGNALGSIGAASIPTLVDVMRKPEPGPAVLAASALGRMGPDAKAAVPDLAKAMASGKPQLVNAAAAASILIDKSTEPTAIAAVAESIRGDDHGAAKDAMTMLQQNAGKIASARERNNAVQALIGVFKGENVELKKLAAACLSAFGPDAKEAVPVLQDAAMGPEMKDAALDALKKIAPGVKFDTKPKATKGATDKDGDLDLGI